MHNHHIQTLGGKVWTMSDVLSHVISTTRRLRQEDNFDFGASLSYLASLRAGRAIE